MPARGSRPGPGWGGHSAELEPPLPREETAASKGSAGSLAVVAGLPGTSSRSGGAEARKGTLRAHSAPQGPRGRDGPALKGRREGMGHVPALVAPQAAEPDSPSSGAGLVARARLTLAGCRQLAVLPVQILHVVQGDGPHGRLAAESGFKHDLTRRERGLAARARGGAPGSRPPPPAGLGGPPSPGTPRRWPPPPGPAATGAAGARPCSTRPAGPGRCSGAPSARPCLQEGGHGSGPQPSAPRPPTPAPGAPGPAPLTEMLGEAHVVPEAKAGGLGGRQRLATQPGRLAPWPQHPGLKERKVAWKRERTVSG